MGIRIETGDRFIEWGDRQVARAEDMQMEGYPSSWVGCVSFLGKVASAAGEYMGSIRPAVASQPDETFQDA